MFTAFNALLEAIELVLSHTSFTNTSAGTCFEGAVVEQKDFLGLNVNFVVIIQMITSFRRSPVVFYLLPALLNFLLVRLKMRVICNGGSMSTKESNFNSLFSRSDPGTSCSPAGF